jgi:hypothetical protein
VRRHIVAAAASVAALILAVGFTPSGSAQSELVADASAIAFTLRPTYDPGGAAPLNFYLGYTEANLAAPPASADGTASWYNLGIAETAIFKPPEECTPDKNLERAQQALRDLGAWVTDEVVPALQAGRQPVAPGPTLPCTQRFRGFAQSRYPATATIKESTEDEIAGLGEATGGVVRDGDFSAKATDAPSQTSSSTLAGVGIPSIISVESARALASVAVEKGKVVSRAESLLTGICIGPTAATCAARIDQVRFTSAVSQAPGSKPDRTQEVEFAGVNGAGLGSEAEEVLQRGSVAQGDSFALQFLSATGSCGRGPQVADAGGLRIFAKGSSGGGVTLGGSCATARAQALSFGTAAPTAPAAPGVGTSIPGTSTTGGIGTTVGSETGPPLVITRQIKRISVRDAPAWRTAPYWASTLGALVALAVIAFVFRRNRYIGPIWRRIDRFSRQFVRG